MTAEKYNKMTGMELLRLVVRNFNYCSENFNDRFNAEEILKLHKAWLLSEWDIAPDEKIMI